MPEYYLLRFFLSLTEYSLAFLIYRSGMGYLFPFFLLTLANATGHLIPARLDSLTWWGWIFLPLSLIRLTLALYTSLDLFSFIRKETRAEERRAAGIGAFTTAGLILYYAWEWRGTGWFDSVMILRQYTYLCLTVVAGVTYWYYLVYRKLDPPQFESFPNLHLHALTWCGYLVLLTFLSTTAEKGLFWSVVEWKGRGGLWRWIGDGGLILQTAIMWFWWFRIIRRHGQIGRLTLIPGAHASTRSSIHF